MDSAEKQIPPAARRGVPSNRGAEWVPRLVWLAPISFADVADQPTAPTEAVAVFANENRWIAECPDCHGAQMACKADARFMCNECANGAIGGKWRPVVWPADVDQIEAVLDQRPLVNRNWLPGESLDDLRAKNAEHGLRRLT